MKLPTRAELSPEQEDIFRKAPLKGCVLIKGPPGTGKTVMAVYRARLLKKQGTPFKIVMFNHVLKSYTSVALSGMEENMATWHSWICSWWRAAYGKNIPSVANYVYDWSAIISQYMSADPRNGKRLNWGHLIVDEGQDFPPGFYMLCGLVVNNPKSGSPAVTILADDNQRLQAKINSRLDQIEENLSDPAVYRLTKNFRNTRQIAEMAQEAFYTGDGSDLAELPDRKGPVPELRRFSALDDEVESITRLARLNEDQSIGVFLPTVKLRECFFMKIHKSLSDSDIEVQTYRNARSINLLNLESDKGVTVICGESCKGLEFDHVFIPQLQLYSITEAERLFVSMKFYVMSTRARSGLYFSYSESEDPPAVLDLFPDSESGLIKLRNMG